MLQLLSVHLGKYTMQAHFTSLIAITHGTTCTSPEDPWQTCAGMTHQCDVDHMYGYLLSIINVKNAGILLSIIQVTKNSFMWENL